MTVEAPTGPRQRAVCLQIIFTQYNYTTDYTVVTGHWQLLKAEISEHIESISTQIWQEVSSSLEIH